MINFYRKYKYSKSIRKSIKELIHFMKKSGVLENKKVNKIKHKKIL